MGVTRDTIVPEGAVVVRVGCDGMHTHKGVQPVFPVVELIWPKGDLDWNRPSSASTVTYVWTDGPTSYTPGRKKRCLQLFVDGLPWANYQCSRHDREMFESLVERWGMWFLVTNRQGSNDVDHYVVMSKKGGCERHDFLNKLKELVTSTTFEEVRKGSSDMLDKALAKIGEGEPPDVAEKFRRYLKDEFSEHLTSIFAVLEDIGGPLPWPQDRGHFEFEVTKPLHEEIAETYIGLLTYFNRVRTGQNPVDNEEIREHSIAIWRLLKKARIFEIAPAAFADLYHGVDVYTTEVLAGLPWHPPGVGDVSRDEGRHLLEVEIEEGKKVPFPEHLPFEVNWLATGRSIMLTDTQLIARSLDPRLRAVTTGYLVCSSGDVYEILLVDTGGRIPQLLTLQHCIERRWVAPQTLSPWLIRWLIDAINEHQSTLVIEYKPGYSRKSFFERKMKKARKQIGIKKPVPPPFYPVFMRDRIAHRIVDPDVPREKGEGKRGEGDGREYSHRWDRRATWCYRILRGLQPLDYGEELKLIRRDYRVYNGKELDPWAKSVLAKKGQPPRRKGEWIAIRKWRRAGGICGPKDKPYRPSIRKATTGILARSVPGEDPGGKAA